MHSASVKKNRPLDARTSPVIAMRPGTGESAGPRNGPSRAQLRVLFAEDLLDVELPLLRKAR